jgi:hypothetical protein
MKKSRKYLEISSKIFTTNSVDYLQTPVVFNIDTIKMFDYL